MGQNECGANASHCQVIYQQILGENQQKPAAQEFDFAAEQQKLKNYIVQIQELGPEKLAATPSLSLKKLNATEWNNLIYKHIDHHLRQFGV